MNSTTRRNFLSRIAAVASLPAMSFVTHYNDEDDRNTGIPLLEGRKILFTHGGWDGHEPDKYVEWLTPWMKDAGAEVILSDTLDPYTDESLMKSIDLVIQIFTMSQISNEQQAGLLKAVRENGTGIAGWHGGLCDAFRNNPPYQYMTGGQWVEHPGGVIDYTVEITNHRDAVTKGLKGFPMHSEQYFMHVDPNVKVLATTTFNGEINSWIDGCVMPVAWKKMYGKGRIFYTSLGHNLDHLTAHADAVELFRRGIRWAGASKYLPAEKWVSPVYG